MQYQYQRSLITDHHNKYNNNEKVWNIDIGRIFNMWHRDTKWSNAVEKMVPIDLLNAELPQTFHLLKNAISVKGSKSTVKWSMLYTL